ncbi:hypothetical protein DPMN_065237 [Dreissena polymorpha]|uniref:Uncharacterized protein n=1 Tax=Dreissena polymorpha TaxID=45954 RepID=A0A9D4CEV0_DREPO|nr:hypothetical protein DPMN_065237 [Dreissena polymorpha]
MVEFLTMVEPFYENLLLNVVIRALTRFHVKANLSAGGHVLQGTETIFKIQPRYTYLTVIVTSKVLTRFHYSHKKKSYKLPGGPVFEQTGTIDLLGPDTI